jgi:hypothetical protein
VIVSSREGGCVMKVRVQKSTNPQGIGLGDRVKDRISGLSGIVTGFYSYLFGCERAGITPEEHKDGKPAEVFVVDAAQLELLAAGVVEGYQAPAIGAPRPAGPRADPAPRSTPVR